MNSFESLTSDFTSWMKFVDDAVGDMKDSIVVETLDEQIAKTQVMAGRLQSGYAKHSASELLLYSVYCLPYDLAIYM